MSAPASVRISHLLELLGPTVLLPWPAGSKGGDRKWMHRRLTDMNDDSYLAKLKKAGNIGVALGKASSGLVTIDLDDDNYVDAFLQANPLLTQTLRTRGSRGCNIWLRCSDEYPPSGNLTDLSGTKIGEWRADGNQTIIAGLHPDGMRYRFLVESPVIEIAYNDLNWPKSWIAPRWKIPDEFPEQDLNRVTQVTESQSNRSCLLTSAIESAATTDIHQNNAALFRLARAMIDIKHATGVYPTPDELKKVFTLWADRNRRFWRPGQSWSDYWIDFLQACKDARHGLTENPLDTAWKRARSVPPPEEALRYFDDPQLRLFVSLLRELQNVNGIEPIYASTRAIAERFDISNVTAAKWLKALIPLGILIPVEPGTATRCPRFRYNSLNTIRRAEVLAVN